MNEGSLNCFVSLLELIPFSRANFSAELFPDEEESFELIIFEAGVGVIVDERDLFCWVVVFITFFWQSPFSNSSPMPPFIYKVLEIYYNCRLGSLPIAILPLLKVLYIVQNMSFLYLKQKNIDGFITNDLCKMIHSSTKTVLI